MGAALVWRTVAAIVAAMAVGLALVSRTATARSIALSVAMIAARCR